MLDLKKLLDGSLSSIEFSVDVPECDFVDEAVNGSASASGKVTNHSGVILLEGEIKTNLTVECARCGSEFIYSEPIPLTAKITDKLANEDEEEFILMTDSAIDVDELVRSALILELPSKYLCREDCKGLCPKCGKNLNEGLCSCDTTDRDPRWDVLKDFFGD
ncbi:MAG: DUF177 domain-containing protein [Ruminococcaceae bacterium]|nr:DUF177 domain-containing protein [Oscillospiraceae bacterium]